MKKDVIFAIKGSFRSICNHPFLVGFLCLLVFMYRSCPVMFSLLVSASPVFVCSAVLLGTLLSFGQENVPQIEIEIEEKKCHEPVFVKKDEEILKEAVVVDQDGSYYVAKLSEETIKDAGLGEGSSKEPSFLVVKKIGEICRESDLDETPAESGDERGDKKWEESDVVLSDERIGGTWEEANRELFEKSSEGNEKGLSSDGEVMEGNQYTSIPKANGESMRLDDEKIGEGEHVEEDDDDDDEGLDSVSESESLSPEASMAEVMPMLDELHPLLVEDGPPAVQTPHEGSSSDDDETEAEDDTNNGYNKVGKKKSAITWTEEDQRNLMDLGSSEIERNQRLENLLMRRKVKKNMSMGPQMSLIDFDHPADNVAPSFNLPPPIITTRQNPFDDVYDNATIPGSAPSILLPTRNPFDVPYITSQEKLPPPPIMEVHRVETSSQSREQPYFSRHESFSVGPSIFAQNRQDVQFRPFFMPEAFGTSSYSMFHRIPSEVSESKASSVLTESLGSVEDLEDHKFLQEDNNINNIINIHPQEVSRMEEHEEVIEKCESGDQEQVSKDVSQEPELISKIGHGSHSSGDDDDRHEFDVNLKFQSRDVENPYEEGDLALYSCSSSSSLSGETIFTKTDVEKPKIKTQTSMESTTPSIGGNTLVDDVHHKEPVYDRSPTSHAEKRDLVLPPIVVKRTVSFVERTIEIKDYEREENYGLSSDSDADVFYEVNERLASTPFAAGGTPTVFYDVMHDHSFDLLREVQVPNTPVEAFEKPRAIQNLNISEVHELDHDTSPNFNSSITPDFISMPSSIVSEEEGSSHADVQTISEQANKIREIDGLLSELDRSGDSGLTRWESCSNVLEKALDAKDTISEMPELEATTVKDIDAVYKKFKNEENELGKSTNKNANANTLSEMPELEARTVKDIDAVYKKLNNNTVEKIDTVSEMPELEARTVKDTDAVYKKLRDNTVEKTDTVSKMPELEARTVKDIDAVYKKLSNNAVGKIDTVSEMPELEARTVKDIDGVYKKLSDHAVGNTDTVCEMPELEARTVKDIDAVYKKLNNSTVEKIDTVSEMPEFEARTIKDIDAVYKKLSDNAVQKTDTVSEMPELEARTVKDIDAVYKKLSDKKNELQTDKDTKNTVSEMPELEAKSVKDIDEVYRKFSDKETEKPVVASEGTSSEKLLNGKSDNEVKLNTDKGSSVEIKAEKEPDSSVGKNSLSSAEKPEDVNSTTSGTGWFGASRLRFFG